MEKILNEADVKDLLLSKDSDITVGEAIDILMNSKKVIDSEAEILLSNGEKVTVAELINACKKNEDDEEDKKDNEDEDEKDKEFAEGVDYGEEKEKEEPKKLDKEHESEGEKKHLEEKKEDSKKNSSKLRNAYRTACLNNTKSELQEQADRVCESIFNGIERAKELGI